MLTLKEWFDRCDGRHHEWLVLGKGPSFSLRSQYNLKSFLTLTLNHAVREFPVTAAHIIDWDVFEACACAIDRNARFLLMPFRPHVHNRPGPWDLTQWKARHPMLARLEQEGRLVGYHLSTDRRNLPDTVPVIEVRYFSAEAALRILATCGARTIRSLGIDGGAEYSEEFADLRGTSLLSNRRNSFNEQFQEIASILHTTGVDYAPLHLESPIRIYVGAAPSQELAYQVLAYSISRHASMTTQVIPLKGTSIPMPQRTQLRPRTPFSFSRFLVPQLAGYSGRAIYLDADMLVLKDISQLWQIPWEKADILYAKQPRGSRRHDQFSVLVMNCAQLPWDIQGIVGGLDSQAYSYEDLMYRLCIVPAERIAASIPHTWNSLECYEPGKTALLHYTDMPTQPWVSSANPLGSLWIRVLIQAVQEGRIPLATVEEEVRLGHVRPSLLEEVQGARVQLGWHLRAIEWWLFLRQMIHRIR